MYVEGAVHYRGDLVQQNGSTFQANRDTGRAPPHSDWNLIAAAGRDAPFPKIKGTWRDDASYQYLDIVALGGSAFVARADDPGVCPGDGWQLIASAGKPGKPGIKGERGEPGARGERGERGLPGQAATLFAKWEIDPAQYSVVVVFSDGSKTEPLRLRKMFEQYNREMNSDG